MCLISDDYIFVYKNAGKPDGFGHLLFTIRLS